MINIQMIKDYLLDKPKQPRASYVNTVRDLMALYQQPFSQQQFIRNASHCFSELIDLTQFNSKLHTAELIILVIMRQEFDPDHSHIGSYLQDNFKIKSEMIDICDMGTESLNIGIKLAKQFIQHKVYQEILILCFGGGKNT